MEGEEPEPLTYVHETVLKKRKNNDDWAVKRRGLLEARKQRKNERLRFAIKRPEEFVRAYRNKELDLVRMNHRLKSRRSGHTDLKSKLIFVTRIHGSKDMHPKTRRILNLLRLRNVLDGVFMKANEATIKMLISVEPFVTYGYPNLKSIRDLVYKKGCGKIHQNRIPLTDNNVIEQALGEYGIICIEDIVHEISTLGPHFKKVTSFLCPFQLKRPERQPPTKKQQFKDGGDTGNRQDCINQLIDKLN